MMNNSISEDKTVTSIFIGVLKMQILENASMENASTCL